MHAFMSYQTADKLVAAKVVALLQKFGCTAFMAHEDIEVSLEWRLRILQELAITDLFIPILSANYYASIWCKQESGIAAYRDATIIPLSIDGSIPQGFIAHVQSTKIDPAAPTLANLIPGIAKRDVSFAIEKLITIVAASGGYRHAEANFELINSYLDRATDAQKVALLEASTKNGQVREAGLCIQKYLPPLFAAHGHNMDPALRKQLGDTIHHYKH